MSILIEKVRVFGFRGLKNIEVDLELTSVLTGMNNAGKTSFLKALQIVFGNRQFLTQDDFYVSDATKVNQIVIDVKILPVNSTGERISVFDADWEILFTEDKIRNDIDGNQFIPLRTIVKVEPITNTYKTNQYIQQEWVDFLNEESKYWYQSNLGTEKSFHYEEIPFFYMDAQRDIIDDMKVRNSYLGKMLSNIHYSPEVIREIEAQIADLNEQAVKGSDILSNIETTLKELDTAMDNTNNGIDITPFPKKVRDLNKGISILYSDFSMEYHGMGTRSWSSLLTLKSFISLFDKNSKENSKPFFPIVAIEEPEAHLHPNAQKKLYSQIACIPGQKIISTHSPYIAATTNLEQIRSFYKSEQNVKCGKLDITDFSPEDIRKIKREVINTRGELFFSKIIVLCEGETEEQALTIFAEEYFKKTPMEIGVDFVGIGGFGNYLPFLRLAESLNIPWFILSDGETQVKKKLEKVLKEILKKDEIDLTTVSNVFILEKEFDFENYLLNNGFEDEIKMAFAKLFSETYLENQIRKKDGTSKGRIQTKDVCETCKQNIYENNLRSYSGDDGYKQALYDCMTDNKTPFGPAIAEAIIESGKGLPPIIIALFDKMSETLVKKEI
jgi:putative ATP-dependent endonuclease of OLD family